MFVEFASGYIFGSIALLTDGTHTGIHALALGISFTTYMLARRWSMYASFPFGT
jgi:Co/Zn/Cd efflux system component